MSEMIDQMFLEVKFSFVVPSIFHDTDEINRYCENHFFFELHSLDL